MTALEPSPDYNSDLFEVVRVGDVAEVINGFPFDASLFGPVGIPLVRIRDLDSTEPSMLFCGPDAPAFRVTSDDILIGMDGDFNVGRWRGKEPALLNQRMLALRAEPDIARLLELALPVPLKRINDQTYATTVKHLSSSQVKAIRVLLPRSKEDLTALIRYLDRETAEIDAFIADQEELIALLAERRAATITHAVTKGLDPCASMKDSGVEWIGTVPEAWAIQPLWSLFARTKDVGHPHEPMLSVFREHGVVRKQDFDNINKTAENRNIYQLVHPGWLVANRMKAWQGSVGVSSYRGIVSGHYLCFRPRHRESAEFLNYLFRSRVYAAGYSTLSRGVRIGQAEIDNDQYRLLPVLIPPRAEQNAIVGYLDQETEELDATIADAREAIALSKERRAALISAAVTGKIDVREWRDAR